MLDPRYVVARTVLLDALEALGEQRNAVTVVGAQAIYLHTGTIDLAVPELTVDADLTIDPALLRDVPEIESAMRTARSSCLAAIPLLTLFPLTLPDRNAHRSALGES